jgi:hypothetical protein
LFGKTVKQRSKLCCRLNKFFPVKGEYFARVSRIGKKFTGSEFFDAIWRKVFVESGSADIELINHISVSVINFCNYSATSGSINLGHSQLNNV